MLDTGFWILDGRIEIDSDWLRLIEIDGDC
jgi:hypothetical protein